MNIGNKEFISLRVAASENKYAQEYLGLLARRGILASVRIGKRWYTTRDWVKEFKSESEKKNSKKTSSIFAENIVQAAIPTESRIINVTNTATRKNVADEKACSIHSRQTPSKNCKIKRSFLDPYITNRNTGETPQLRSNQVKTDNALINRKYLAGSEQPILKKLPTTRRNDINGIVMSRPMQPGMVRLNVNKNKVARPKIAPLKFIQRKNVPVPNLVKGPSSNRPRLGSIFPEQFAFVSAIVFLVIFLAVELVYFRGEVRQVVFGNSGKEMVAGAQDVQSPDMNGLKLTTSHQANKIISKSKETVSSSIENVVAKAKLK
jgi:hypothetical protein